MDAPQTACVADRAQEAAPVHASQHVLQAPLSAGDSLQQLRAQVNADWLAGPWVHALSLSITPILSLSAVRL